MYGIAEKVGIINAGIGMQKKEPGAGGPFCGGIHLRSPASPGTHKVCAIRFGNGSGRIRRTAIANYDLKRYVPLFAEIIKETGESIRFVERRDND